LKIDVPAATLNWMRKGLVGIVVIKLAAVINNEVF
jgi:hypothetical protein